jgi:class 3 adenylate cyclase/tetratricopeptide (TPR) repeat protein
MAEPRRERKVVTVLFCDLVGFTSRAESLDPEDVEAMLRPYHARVREELERHGGTVEKFIGDAVMALFGAPLAHEDDPERAVRAALAIRDVADEEGLELRIGVTTGEALIRLDARPEAGEGMASGDVVNTAARLQSAAPVNGVLVDETTYRATRHAMEYAEEPAVEAKGKSLPVDVWVVLGARSRFGVDVAHEARAELVGRERELSIMRDSLARARDERVPQLVTLVGVPGIGKSRLVRELSRIADADPELITWRQGRCLAYGDGITLWALGEIVKAQAGIVEQDGPNDVRTKIRRAASDALGEADEVPWVEPHLLALVGLGVETELGGDRRDEAFAAWRRFLEGLAERGPLVLVFEDLHWADDTLLDFVDELAEWVTDVPLLVLGTARPELLDRRPSWGGGKLNAATLAIPPLDNEQAAVLIGRLLERSLLAAEAQRTLLERVGGNPLYAEQFADLYAERGSTDELPIPETLQGIIAARLDGLGAVEKTLLQDAAVVGEVFWVSSLGDELEGASIALHGLERKGFIRRQKRSSVAGETEFAFAHALVRDVAYGQIPRAERAAKHRRAAEWIASLGRPEDHAEMIAHHWALALEIARAAGEDSAELVERARAAVRDAGDRAFTLNAFDSAERYYREALALCGIDDPGRPDLLFRLGRTLHVSEAEGREAALTEARDALLEQGDVEHAAEAEAFLGDVAWVRGERELAFEHLRRGAQLVAGRPPSRARVRVLAFTSRRTALAGDRATAEPLAKEAFELAQSLGLNEWQAHALGTLALIQSRTGHMESGIRTLRSAIDIALAVSSPYAGQLAQNLASLTMSSGAYRRGVELWEEAWAIQKRLFGGVTPRWDLAIQARLLFELGRWDEALERCDAFIAKSERTPHYLQSQVLSVRARILMARGDDGVLEDAGRIEELARQAGDPQLVIPVFAMVLRVAAELRREQEFGALIAELGRTIRANPDEAVWYTEVISLARDADSLGLEEELRAVEAGASPSPWRDLLGAALNRDFAREVELLEQMGIVTQTAEARLRLAEELIDSGRRAEGEAELEQALDFYRSVGATFYVERGEELLAKAS